jgi:tetratricopeptide (TPR) repeat protein
VGERFQSVRVALAGAIVAAFASAAAAQTGRVVGTVRDDHGDAIKGATVTAENPDASPKSITSSSDGKGRFAMLGLRSGTWTFTAKAPGFDPSVGKLQVRAAGVPGVVFTLQHERLPPPSALGGVAAKDLESDLQAAEQQFNAKRWDDAAQRYQAILSKAPALSMINLQVAQAYRNKAGDLREQDPRADARSAAYDQAMNAYQALLKIDPNSEAARIGVAMTNIERGNLEAAEQVLDEASRSDSVTSEVFYTLGQVKAARGKGEDAVTAYERATQMDPNWGKPIFALGKAALDKGDKAAATRYFEKVVALDPSSPEAAQSQAMSGQLKQ